MKNRKMSVKLILEAGLAGFALVSAGFLPAIAAEHQAVAEECVRQPASFSSIDSAKEYFSQIDGVTTVNYRQQQGWIDVYFDNVADMDKAAPLEGCRQVDEDRGISVDGVGQIAISAGVLTAPHFGN